MLDFKFARHILICSLALLSASLVAHATTAVQSTLFTFSGGNQPSQLIQASDGNFYGTSPQGGASSKGYVFRLTLAGSEIVVYSFTNIADGGTPMASLIEGNDGNLYSTNTTGGSGHGVLFRLTLNGAITVLHTFAIADGTMPGSLIQNNSGDIFGAATTGGASNSGTVFEYSHTGIFSIFHTFTGTAGDGSLPNTQLVQASDGFIYGATRRGGASASGSLFHFNPSVAGSFSTFASFPPTGQSDPAYNPSFGMTEGADGALYGLTAEGGSGFSGYGTIYKVIPASSPTLTLNLHSLNGGTEGGLPESGLTLGGDGNFYGTTSSYGPGGPPNGTIFQYIPSGAGLLTTLYGFSSPNGDPTGTPLEGSDGNFYGPASSQIYKLALTPQIPAPITLDASSSAISLGQPVTLDWHVTNAFSQTAKNCYAHGDWSGSKAITGSETITPTTAGTRTYALTCGGVESAVATVLVVPILLPKTATPVITPNGGAFAGPTVYKITDATAGAVIHYTTDGTAPALTSPVWGGVPLVLISNTTIKAIAIASSMTVSNVASAIFTIRPSVRTACTVDYSRGFASFAGLQLNHGASVVGSILEMTHGAFNESTSAFTKTRIPLKVFATEFLFRFSDATTTSADGLTFTVQAKSSVTWGGGGSGLGYAGIPNSMALKFDLRNNAGEGSNSVGLFFGGALPTIPSVDLTPSGINLHSGHTMAAYVTYDGANLSLDLSDTTTGKHFTHNFSMPVANPFGATTAFAGFTAGTGAATSHAQVLAWEIESAGPCVVSK